jgi:hypothetical protein
VVKIHLEEIPGKVLLKQSGGADILKKIVSK